MRDIVYGGFAQLSYLNWHNLTTEFLNEEMYGKRDLKTLFTGNLTLNQIKTPIYDKEWKHGDEYYLREENGKRIYDARDSRIFYLYSEDIIEAEKNPKFSEIGEWEFLCAYNHEQIRAEAGGIIAYKDSGFQASAFKKGNQVMIAYRGTDEGFDWGRTNLSLGTNKYVDQLTCTAWFYDKVKELAGENAEIHITGHSLGGCLAQFAFIYSECKCETKTWNGLGVGGEFKDFNIFSTNLNLAYVRDTLEDLDFLNGDMWQEKCIKANSSDIHNISKRYIEKHNNPHDFDDGTDRYINLDESKCEVFESEISFKLKVLYLFQSNYNRACSSSKLENIYFTNDLTPNLQKRAGIITKADKDYEEIEADKGDSSILRKLKMIFLKAPAAYHSVANFLAFIDGEGNIKQGVLNENHILNAIKTLLLSKGVSQKSLKRIMEKGKINNEPLKWLKDGMESTGKKDIYSKMLFDVKTPIMKYHDKEKPWFQTDEEFAYLGKFSNLSELAGVTYGSPEIFKLRIVKLADFNLSLDPASQNFMEQYEGKYGLDERESPLYHCIDILDKNKPLAERYKKVFVWNLAYQLLVSGKKYLAKNGETVADRDIRLENIKELFEEIIDGYTKTSYESEVNERKAVWQKWGNMETLKKSCDSKDQPNLIKYIESYEEEKEKKKAANAENAKAHEAAKEKEENDKFCAKQRAYEKRMKEVAVNREGLGGHVATSQGYFSRDEYYNKIEKSTL